ncbi:MAG: patatin-like phospholipase family protein [Bacteroidetes bacterium]|nr:MAG: patatin-like phospholipase family protein [Bacteroidota bacterium]
MNALVISGGGNKGAYAGGVAEFLVKKCKMEYDVVVGTSTGGLLAPLVAIGEIDKLKATFTRVTQKDIFKICPFIIKKKREGYQTAINHLGIVRMFLRGKKTFGDSCHLKQLIRHTFTADDFRRLRASGKRVIVTVANLTNEVIEYKSSDEYDYDAFCDWIWASANMLPFMSLYEKDGCEYGDGGFGNLIPIQKAINLGATFIDVIALRPEMRVISSPPSRNAFHVLSKTYDFMLNQIGLDDLLIGQLEAAHKRVDMQFYHTPRILTGQNFIFDPVLLKAWWEEGYEVALKSTPKTHCLKPSKTARPAGEEKAEI